MKESFGRELLSVTRDRDHLQEQLQSISLEREEGEGGEGEGGEGEGEEGEEGEGEEKEEKKRETRMSEGGALQSQKNSEVLQRIRLVEEMNLKASNGVKETKLKTKVHTEQS